MFMHVLGPMCIVLPLVEADDESGSLRRFIARISVTRAAAVVSGPLLAKLSPYGIDNCKFG